MDTSREDDIGLVNCAPHFFGISAEVVSGERRFLVRGMRLSHFDEAVVRHRRDDRGLCLAIEGRVMNCPFSKFTSRTAESGRVLEGIKDASSARWIAVLYELNGSVYAEIRILRS